MVPQDERLFPRPRSLRPADDRHAERRHRPVVAGGYRIFDIAAREIYEAQGHPMPPGGKPDLVNANPLRYSYENYATQTRRLWRGFDKPAIIGESGWDHTYYEPGTPGYLAMHHNALWTTLVNGTCATPFWWALFARVNDSVLDAADLRALRAIRARHRLRRRRLAAGWSRTSAPATAGRCRATIMFRLGCESDRRAWPRSRSRSPGSTTARTKCGSIAPGAASIWIR